MFGPQKRKIQDKLNRILYNTNKYQGGTIVSLMGEEPTEYVRNIIGTLRPDDIQLYEIDHSRFILGNKAVDNNLDQNFFTQLWLYNDDLFGENGPVDPNISGVDLDFCECLRGDLAIYVGLWLSEVLNRNEINNVWFRLTSAIGPRHSKEIILDRLNSIIDYIKSKNEWVKVGKSNLFTYRDSRAMLVWQCQLERKENKMATKNVKKTVKNDRYMKDLTENEQEQVRSMLADYHDVEKVGKKFRLNERTVKALRAHQTMGTYGWVDIYSN